MWFGDSSPTRTRTWNKPVNSRLLTERNHLSGSTSGDTPVALAQPLAQALPDPDLARLCSLWPALPGHIRAAILALVAAVR
jgi:hypothetical protein